MFCEAVYFVDQHQHDEQRMLQFLLKSPSFPQVWAAIVFFFLTSPVALALSARMPPEVRMIYSTPVQRDTSERVRLPIIGSLVAA